MAVLDDIRSAAQDLLGKIQRIVYSLKPREDDTYDHPWTHGERSYQIWWKTFDGGGRLDHTVILTMRKGSDTIVVRYGEFPDLSMELNGTPYLPDTWGLQEIDEKRGRLVERKLRSMAADLDAYPFPAADAKTDPATADATFERM